ncbi:MAG: D-2-hydroxyacid dehydrogenase [Oscillospiraceae bacterium]|nr:D-2-hydroxyacid dehydrogenase [Oscillospiraceae bacterium]
MKMVVLDGYTLNPGDISWERIEQFGELEIYDRTSEEDIVSRIDRADIVFTNKTPISRHAFEACPNIRFVCVLATGYNIVDVEAAKDNGVIVSNIPSYGTASVAQFVFALLLEICHHVGAHSESVRKGDWSACPDYCYWHYPLIELANKTMGVIGLGRIGQNTALIAQAFGMKVLAYDELKNTELETASCKYTSLDELYEKSDVISLHCPLFPKTQGMINRDSISMMKDGVIIINTSRGPLIVERDLVEALEQGKVGYAAIDVVEKEPIPEDSPLLRAKNCIITPHIAWAPKESRQRLMNSAAENVRAFLSGAPINTV